MAPKLRLVHETLRLLREDELTHVAEARRAAADTLDAPFGGTSASTSWAIDHHACTSK